MELAWQTELDKMFIVNAPPQHDNFKILDAKIIAAGEPAKSLLPYRMNKRGPGQMPPLATSLPDAKGIELLNAWIKSLKR